MTGRLSFSAALFACAVTFVVLAPAQNAPKIIKPTGQLKVDAAMERTPADMDAFEATHVAPAPRAAPFRPTIDPNLYRALKQSAAAAPSRDAASEAPTPQHPPATTKAFPGAVQSGWIPPDTVGAIGLTQYVEAVNSQFHVYSKSGASLKSITLNSFFGYATQPFFDPRVMYDEIWNRWIVTAAAFPQSATSQIYGIAISQTNSALGKWWIYLIDVGFYGGSGGFYDFPEIGLNQDAIIFTANIFTSGGFAGAAEYSFPKARAYNGLGFGYEFFTGLIATLSAPHVLDQNPCAWLAAAPSGSGAINMYALCSPSGAFPQVSLFGPYTVSGVAAYTVPAPAAQPVCGGGTHALDTSDNRFVTAGTQNGDLYYQAHSVFSLATARYYIISGLSSFAPAVAESGNFYGDSLSADFNVSIAADGLGELALTWTSVNAGAGPYNAQVRYVGKQSGDPTIAGVSGTAVLTSGTCLTGNFDPNFGHQRWGDYSAVTVDPSSHDPKTFWFVNEDILGASTWGSEIVRIHF